MRLFVGMPVPGGPAYEEAGTAILAAAPRAKLVPTGTWHVTLRFLGELPSPEPVQAALGEALAGIAATPGQVVGIGAFPDRRRAAIVWAGVLAPGIEGVAARVRQATARFGEPPDDRPFTPHVTLARLREPRDVAGLLAAHAVTSFGPAPFDHVVLFSSRLGPAGPRYEAAERFRLAPGPGQGGEGPATVAEGRPGPTP